MSLFRRSGPDLPDAVVRALALTGPERVIAAAPDLTTGAWVCVTTWRLVVVTVDATVALDRPWHEVDAGAWDPDAGLLTVSWVGRGRATQFRFADEAPGDRLPGAFRDRVSASVVLTTTVDLGPRRTSRVVIRTDLASRELLEQVLPGRGSSSTDAELAEAVAVARADLRDQVGMPPAP